MTTSLLPRIVLEVDGRRYVLATSEEVERLRELNLSHLLTLTHGQWFIDDGPVGTEPIREPIEDD